MSGSDDLRKSKRFKEEKSYRYAVVYNEDEKAAFSVDLLSKVFFPDKVSCLPSPEARQKWKRGDKVDIWYNNDTYEVIVWSLCRKLDEKMFCESELAEHLAEQSVADRDQEEDEDSRDLIIANLDESMDDSNLTRFKVNDRLSSQDRNPVDEILDKINADNSLIEQVNNEINHTSINVPNDQISELISMFKSYVDKKSSEMTRVESQLSHILKQLSSFNRRLQRIETATSTQDTQPSKVDFKTIFSEATPMFLDQDVVTWMGIDVKDRINRIVDEAMHFPSKFAIEVALKMWGNRNLRYWVINNSVVARKKKKSMRAKDPTGVQLLDDILWRFTFTLRKKRISDEAASRGLHGDEAETFQKNEEKMVEANKVHELKSAYHQINQFGLDCWKKKYHQKHCLYYELLESGAKPRSDWTIHEEVNLASVKDEERNVTVVQREESPILDEINRLTKESWTNKNSNEKTS